jgi:nicotinamidase-related amidase
MAKTLLEMAGADLTPANLNDATLLLIDCQNEYRSGGLPLPGVDAAINEVGILLAAARSGGAPIIHVAHKGRAGSLFDRDADNGALMKEAAPQGDEALIEKALPNAFAGTELAAMLEATGRKQLVVAGFMTHMCISSTVRSALDHGYFSTVVASACATRDLPALDGSVMPAADLHHACLIGLSDRFAVIATDTAFVN